MFSQMFELSQRYPGFLTCSKEIGTVKIDVSRFKMTIVTCVVSVMLLAQKYMPEQPRLTTLLLTKQLLQCSTAVKAPSSRDLQREIPCGSRSPIAGKLQISRSEHARYLFWRGLVPCLTIL